MELIVTVLTQDRPGVVESVSATIAAHGGSWQESRLAQLAGMFAGIIAVDVPEDAGPALAEQLRAMTDVVSQVTQSAGAAPAETRHTLLVVANDRPGIVAEVSRALAAMSVNVAELSTTVEQASMSGGTIFRARLDLGLAPGQELPTVIAGLEGLSADLMIDVVDGEQGA